MNTNLTEDIIFEILEGKYYNSNLPLSTFYVKNEFSLEWEIKIASIKVIENIDFHELLNLNLFIYFIDCEFCEEISFHSTNVKKYLRFYNCTFNKSIKVRGGYFSQLSFDSCTINGELNIFQTKIDNLHVDNCASDKIIIQQGTFGALNINHVKTKYLGIHNKETLIDSISITLSKTTTEFIIEEVTINTLCLYGKLPNNCQLNIHKANLNTLYFNEFSNNGKFSLKNITINRNPKKRTNMTIGTLFSDNNISEQDAKYYFSHCKNHINKDSNILDLFIPSSGDPLYEIRSKLLLVDKSHISSNNTFTIKNVQIGDAEFRNFNLNDFSDIIVSDTDLSTLKLFNSSFPPNKVYANSITKYEVFNDLANVAKNQNNKNYQIEYYKASRQALLKSIRENGRWKYFSTYTSLGVAWIYSNHGTRWIQALGVTIALTSILFTVLMLSTHYRVDLYTPGSWDKFLTLCAFYFQFLNPTHNIHFMDNLGAFNFSTHLGFVIGDLFGRIVVGIGIYEIIRSFRKLADK